MNTLEAVAAVLGLVNVTLVVRRSVWNYPFGLAMVALYAVVFFEAKLYSDALLQIFFFAVQIYGWANWARSRAASGEVRVELLGDRARWLLGLSCAAAILVWGTAMDRLTDAVSPHWDAAIAMMSVWAQLLMARRYLESWALWIAVDLLAVGLFASRGLLLTSVLYAVFLGLASWGLVEWLRARRRMAA